MMTIASDDEVEAEDDSETEAAAAAATAAAAAAARPALTKAGKKRQRQKAVAKVKKGIEVDPSFSFDVDASLGLAERQAVRGWDFKSESSIIYEYQPAACIACSQALLQHCFCNGVQQYRSISVLWMPEHSACVLSYTW